VNNEAVLMNEKRFKQLEIIYSESTMVWCYCVFHKDAIRPNLSVSLLDKYYGRWKCWACGRCGRLSKKQMNELSLSCSVVHKKHDHNLCTKWEQLNRSCYDNLQKLPLLKLGLAKQLNISTKSLDEWLVGYDGNTFTIPMFREDLSEYNRECGMCGIQRRFPDGAKRCVAGSRLGLMYPQHYIGDYYIFICEGFSDGISVWDLGLNSIARPHCRYTSGVEVFFGDVLDVTQKVIIIPDNDVMGISGAKQLRDILSGLCCNDCYYDTEGFAAGLLDVSIFLFDGAKDIRNYITKVGKRQVKKELERYID